MAQPPNIVVVSCRKCSRLYKYLVTFFFLSPLFRMMGLLTSTAYNSIAVLPKATERTLIGSHTFPVIRTVSVLLR